MERLRATEAEIDRTMHARTRAPGRCPTLAGRDAAPTVLNDFGWALQSDLSVVRGALRIALGM